MATNIFSPLTDMKQNRCRWCDTPFDEIPESQSIPGVCEFCEERRKLFGRVVKRKSGSVDLDKFSIYGHKGDWLEVTEWTNGEGIDILIHYANDHDETNHTFMLSYDEYEAIINIVHSFDSFKPVIYADFK